MAGVSAFRRGGAGKRRDANEAAIVETLQAYGCRVWRIGGSGLPDLLVWYRGRAHALEVKTATGRKTDAQADVPWPIVRSVDEAVAVVLLRHP